MTWCEKERQIVDFFDKLVAKLVEVLGLSEEDAVVTAASAAAGFALDTLFFPGGMPPFTVTILFGIGGYTAARAFKNNPWYRRRVLKNLDKLVEQGHLSRERCDYYKNKLIAKWLKAGQDIEGDAP